MEELSAFHGLHQHITQPTRGENTLDLILSDFWETSVVVNVLDPIGASDHDTVVATFDATPLREPPTKRRVWRYAQADWAGFDTSTQQQTGIYQKTPRRRADQ